MGPLEGVKIVDMTSVLGGERVVLELTFVVLIAITVVDLSFVIPGSRQGARRGMTLRGRASSRQSNRVAAA